MQRNPSHFGSYYQPSPVGISSTERASIGANGGFNSIVSYCFANGALLDAN